MAIDFAALTSAIISPAQRLGVFEKVNGAEPKSAPGKGVVCSYWVEGLYPIPAKSGVDKTTMGLVYQARIQTSMLEEPVDKIDPQLLDASARLMAAYHDDFDLSAGNPADQLELDLLGEWWAGGLAARAGYITQGTTTYRAMVMSIPVTIYDPFGQVR